MALDFIASADGTKIPTRTRTDGAPASGTVEVPEGVTDILDGSGNPVPVSATEPMPIIAGTGVTLPVAADFTKVGGAAITLGQKTMASSLPVVLASDQGAIPVTGSFSASPADNVVISSGTMRDPLATVKGTNSSGGFSATISAAMPASVASGDTLVLIVTQALSPTFTTPSGWTLYATTFTVSNVKAVIYTKTAAGTEGGTNVTVASTVLEDYGTTTYVFNGTVTIEANASSTALSATTITCPSLASVSESGRLVIDAYISGGTSAGLPSIGATGQTMTAQAGSAASSTVAIRTGYEQIATGGSASQRTTSAGNVANSLGIALIVAIPSQTTSWFSTTGYPVIAIALTGNWAGNVQINGSHDQVRADALLVQETNGAYIEDEIIGPGLYFVRSITPFIQINTTQLFGTITYSIVGKSGMGPDSLSILSQAIDPASTVNLNVNVAQGLARDANNALLLSDCKTLTFTTVANQVINFDTIGYQSFEVQSVSFTSGNVICSNDGINYPATASGVQVGGSASVTTNSISAGQIQCFPVVARYYRIPGAAAGTVTIILRNTPVTVGPGGRVFTDITHVGGTAVQTAGLTGLLAVGGITGAGSAPAGAPNQMSGVDPGNLVRRILTDTSGRVATTSTAQLLPSQSLLNVAPLNVVDTSNHEKIPNSELLWQILTELKIHSYYLSQMPAMLNSPYAEYGFPGSEEPAALRNQPQDLDHPVSN